jgi:hypothetical protein
MIRALTGAGAGAAAVARAVLVDLEALDDVLPANPALVAAPEAELPLAAPLDA